MSALVATLIALPSTFLAPSVRANQDGAGLPSCGAGVELLGFSEALNKATFGDFDVAELSGLTYDPSRGAYIAIADRAGSIHTHAFTLELPIAGYMLGNPAILDATVLNDAAGVPFTGATFDGEGVALTPGGDLLVASEGGSVPGEQPEIRRFSPSGAHLGELPIPPRFLVGANNLSFESLTLSPTGRSLFTANERPLAAVGASPEDGQTSELRNRIRLLRYEDRDPDGFVPAGEFYYLTEPDRAPGDVGVVDLVAVSETTLLVLERGFVDGQGNTVRLFSVSLESARDISGEPTLGAAGLVPLAKTFVLDLADCPPGGAQTPPGATQPNPLLDNFEGIALGPRLPDGRHTLLLISDDNENTSQTTRVIALAVTEQRLGGGG